MNTLNFTNRPQGLRYAVSFDSNPLVLVNMDADPSQRAWAKSVSDEIKIISTQFHVSRPGMHTLYFWRVDPGVDLQKLAIDFGGEKSSYLGPPESFHQEVH